MDAAAELGRNLVSKHQIQPEFPFPSDQISRLLFFSSLSLLLFVFFGWSDGMEREACVCDHGYERSDLCAEIIIIIII